MASPGLRSLRQIALPTITAVIWLVIVAISFAMPPVLGTLWAIAILRAFAWRYSGCRPPPERQRRQRALARLRPLGCFWPWIALAAPIFALGQVCFLLLYLQIAGMPTGSAVLVPRILEKPHGWMVVAANLVLAGPFIEELCTRGWIQGALERKMRPALAIALTSVVFAVAHFDLWGIPGRLFSGVVFGVAVRLTRSLWAGVILHSALNSAALSLLIASRHRDLASWAAADGTLLAAAVGLGVALALLSAIAFKLKSLRVARA